MYIKLDIRVKILLLIVANVLMFKKLDPINSFYVGCVFTFFVGVFYSVRKMFFLFLIYTAFTIYELYLSKFVHIIFLDNFLAITIFMFKAVFLPICAGIILVGSSKVSELISFLRKIKLPKSAVIVLAVLFRFFPVLLSDYKNIKNALKMKGIGVDRFYFIKHPFKFFEYVFVPYVIISTNIANELSASCLCRGIDNSNTPTSIHSLKFKLNDYIAVLIIILITIFVEIKL